MEMGTTYKPAQVYEYVLPRVYLFFLKFLLRCNWETLFILFCSATCAFSRRPGAPFTNMDYL